MAVAVAADPETVAAIAGDAVAALAAVSVGPTDVSPNQTAELLLCILWCVPSPPVPSDSTRSTRQTTEPPSCLAARGPLPDGCPVERELFGEEPDGDWAEADKEEHAGPA